MKCKKIIKFIGGLVLSLSLLFSTTCVEAAKTGKRDKFVNTPCTAYGTADAIYNGAGYAAYSSVTY